MTAEGVPRTTGYKPDAIIRAQSVDASLTRFDAIIPCGALVDVNTLLGLFNPLIPLGAQNGSTGVPLFATKRPLRISTNLII